MDMAGNADGTDGPTRDAAPPPRRRRSRVRDRSSLAGPVPMAWMSRACAAGGSALALGIALWCRKGVGRPSTRIIRVDSALRKSMDLTPDQARRAVAALARHGLVRMHAGGRGRFAEVEILDVTALPSLAPRGTPADTRGPPSEERCDRR